MANDILMDVSSQRAHWIEMYKNGRIREMLDRLAITETAILDQFGHKGLTSLAQVRALQDKTAVIMVEGLDGLIEELTQELKDFGVADAEFEAATIAKAIGEVAAISAPTSSQIWAIAKARPFAGKLLKEAFSEFTDTAQVLIKNQIKTAFYEGYTATQLVESLAGTPGMGFRDGIFGNIRRQAAMVTKTSISHYSSVAREKVYQDNDDVVIGVKWLSTLDGRTSAICRFLDGETFPVNKGQRPPAHPNCRSTTIPVLDKRYDILGDKGAKRASSGAEGGKAVSASLTYGEWLKRQPASFQDEVLGKKKGRLFRLGGLSIDKYINNGRELTLAELKAKFPDAWKAAKIEAKR